MTYPEPRRSPDFHHKSMILQVANKLLRGFTFESITSMQAAFRSIGADPLPDHVRDVRVAILKILMRDWQIKHEELK